MSVGDCFENALCESLFAWLECELIDRSTFRTLEEARPAVFRWIEGWYSPVRRHSGLGRISPVNFERWRLHNLSADSVNLSGLPG